MSKNSFDQLKSDLSWVNPKAWVVLSFCSFSMFLILFMIRMVWKVTQHMQKTEARGLAALISSDHSTNKEGGDAEDHFKKTVQLHMRG